MTIKLNSALVSVLRERTNLPLMKCKKALVDTKKDYETKDEWITAAIEQLRKQGETAADNMAGRATPCGRIGLINNGNTAIMVLLGCQTDFVANSDVFKDLVKDFVEFAAADDVGAFGDYSSQKIKEAILKLGENIVLVKTVTRGVTAPEQKTVGYNHDGKVATVVVGTGDPEKLKNIALHITAADPAPEGVTKDDVPAAIVAKEKEIISALPEVLSKPEAIRPKIIEGKMGRFFKERTLLSQLMLIDNLEKETVEQYLKRNNLTIQQFERYSV